MRRAATVEQAVRILNEALEADPVAMDDLFGHRAKCNYKLVRHRTIQVIDGGIGNRSVGLVGIINGIFGVDDDYWGAIAAQYDLECGCVPVDRPGGAELGEVCDGCGQTVDLGRIIKFMDNGRDVGHTEQ